jgi:acetyl-CoA carboxylase carboxyl transferase subunit alpha
MKYIPFEKPIVDLESQVQALKSTALVHTLDLVEEMKSLEEQTDLLKENMYSSLSAYETTQLSRHPERPNVLEYINLITSSFIELHGDRNFEDDPAIVCGIAKIETYSVLIIGHQKGRGTKDNINRNFGMPKPEGYRKALRMMKFAEKFKLPIISLIDTPGAYPGLDAEQRGQSEAIGKNILSMVQLNVPSVSVVIGEGGSGGALALGVSSRVHMMKNAIYSVISPEGCASILLRDASRANEIAEALKLTAKWALELNVIDSIIPEPNGGAHTDHQLSAKYLKKHLLFDLAELSKKSISELKQERYDKYLSIGVYKN